MPGLDPGIHAGASVDGRVKPGRDERGRRGRSVARRHYWEFAWLWPMICGAVNDTPQGGNALSEKNCSFRSGK